MNLACIHGHRHGRTERWRNSPYRGTVREGMKLLLQPLTGLGLSSFESRALLEYTAGSDVSRWREPLAITNLLWLLNHHWVDWSGMTKAIHVARLDGPPSPRPLISGAVLPSRCRSVATYWSNRPLTHFGLP